MKLIQLNTLSGFAGRKILDFMREQNADFFHLQEVVSSPKGRSDFFDFLENAQKSTKAEWVFFSPTHDYHFVKIPVYFGNAILSQHKISHAYEEFTHQAYKKEYDTTTDSELSKLFQHAVVTTAFGKQFNLVNYHGHNVKNVNKAGNAETEKHCQRIADFIATLSGPLILSGDFNLAPDSKSLEPLNACLRNLCIENKVETTYTAMTDNNTVVDYIWVSSDITVNRFEVLPDIVSDHAALLLEFDV